MRLYKINELPLFTAIMFCDVTMINKSIIMEVLFLEDTWV